MATGASAAQNWAMDLRIVIAVRGGPDAKSRCAEALAPGERATLAALMLEDMLAALGGREVAVVTPTKALMRAGMEIIVQPRPSGLNDAFALAMTTIADNAPLALLPGDLPALSTAEMDAASALLKTHEIVAAPSRDGGTSALLMRAGVRIAPAFGPQSFDAHRAAARADGHSCGVYEADGFLHDVDTPDDLAELARDNPHTRSGAWLRERLLASAPRA